MKNVSRQKISLKEIKKAVEEMISLGAIQINLTGGEPLLDKDTFEIIKCLQPHKTILTMNTNGLLLSDVMIDRLEKAGVDIIKISIDSPIAEEHDRSRGYKGCFKQAIRALAYIKNKKMIIGQISTVCVRKNLNSSRIIELVKLAKTYNALLGLTIPAASGRWVNEEEILLRENERGILNELIKFPNVIRDTDEAYAKSHCPAGSEELYVTCYGDVIPCPLIQISFGNIKKEALYSIWKRMSGVPIFKNKRQFGCLAGENRKFIRDFLLPLKDYDQLPLSFQRHPMIEKEY
jgi:MoaA/NifB/PqqE/SkfB family radical SAM enzyme